MSKKTEWKDLENIEFPSIGEKVICIRTYQNYFKVDCEYEVINITYFHVWLPVTDNILSFNKMNFYEFFKRKE